jgi:GNAT superfamily N-acetyltransferase
VRLLALLIGELESLVLIRNAVPELLDQLEPLGGRELEKLLSKGVHHSHQSASEPLKRQASPSSFSRRPRPESGSVGQDAEAVAKLHAESWRNAYRGAYRDEFLDGDVFDERAEVWRERLCEPRSSQFVLIAEDAAQIAGFACAYGGDDPQWGTLLDNLHVRRALQRQGLGARLVCRVGVWCRAEYPDCGLYLWVLEQNDRARAFYERMGARDRGGARFDAPGGGEIQSRRCAWSTLAEVAALGAEAGESATG